jgi:hypothetical protein
LLFVGDRFSHWRFSYRAVPICTAILAFHAFNIAW